MESVARDGAASKKKSLYAAEQGSEANQERRSSWREQVSRIDPEKLIFMDESGVATEMTRRYGRMRGGRRLREEDYASMNLQRRSSEYALAMASTKKQRIYNIYLHYP